MHIIEIKSHSSEDVFLMRALTRGAFWNYIKVSILKWISTSRTLNKTTLLF